MDHEAVHSVSVNPLKALIYPALAGFSDACDDLLGASKETTSLRLIEKVLHFKELENLRMLRRLWCFGINAERLEIIARCSSVTNLFIETLRTSDLLPFTKLRNLESLRIDTASKVDSLERIAELNWLSSLAIEHFRHVRSLEPLGRLTRLHALAVTGSMWTTMKVESLAPLSNLKDLKFLGLTNLKSIDGSLEPLQELKRLEDLECPNFYSWEQFAKLSAALPKTRCDWFQPFFAVSFKECKKCGGIDGVMLSGKGQGILCRKCDDLRIRKHEENFNAVASR